MKPVPSLLVAAGAMVFFAAGYAKGAASEANPFIHVMLLPKSGVAYVEGPDAEPPPWPADAPQASAFPPETRKVSTPSSNIIAALNTPPATIPTPALYPASNPPPAETRQDAPSQGLQEREMREMPPPRRVAVKKDVTFGVTWEGRPVTIIWDQ